MSDLTLFNKDKLPAYLKKIEMDETSKSLLGSGGSPRISIKGSVFRKIINGEEVMRNEDRAMNVIFLRMGKEEYRTFYADSYKEGATTTPDCWSSDGTKPDSVIPNPQSSSCADCPQNIKGSGQGDSRACRFSRWTAVALENDLDGEVLQLVLPSQSVFGKGEKGKLPLRQYAKFLAGHNLPVTAVVTEMRFDTDSATPKLTFKPVRPLEEDEYLKCRDLAESPEAVEAVTMTFTPKDDTEIEVDEESEAVVKAAAAKHAKKPKVETPDPEVEEPAATKPAAKTPAAEAPADDEEEPPKVKGKKKPEDVKSVLDMWADDDDDED